mgnify:CR=1 FL=1
MISIRAPARGATLSSSRRKRCFSISIRAPARGATDLIHCMMQVHQFQSALPRGERLQLFRCVYSFLYFNPRSREGSDNAPQNILTIEKSFQSALPRGERLGVAGVILYCVSISIRAPARGATRPVNTIRPCGTKFQSALPRGERRSSTTSIYAPQRFQSALPRGERPLLFSVRLYLLHFNPRSREGSDYAIMSFSSTV